MVFHSIKKEGVRIIGLLPCNIRFRCLGIYLIIQIQEGATAIRLNSNEEKHFHTQWLDFQCNRKSTLVGKHSMSASQEPGPASGWWQGRERQYRKIRPSPSSQSPSQSPLPVQKTCFWADVHTQEQGNTPVLSQNCLYKELGEDGL